MHLTIFMPSFGDGGVERMLVNLAGGLAARGVTVDFVTRHREAPYLDQLPPTVTVVALGRNGEVRTVFAFIQHLRRARPDFVLCGKDRAARTALRARRLGGVSFQLIMRPGTTVSERLARRNTYKRNRAFKLIRDVYAEATAIVGNSQGVVDDIARISGAPSERVHLIRNPVVTAALPQQANQALDDPWFAPGNPPVIIALGGLRRQKGFDTLIRAFSKLQAHRPCRLIILGKGRLQTPLEELAKALGVGDSVELRGFDPNPYRFVSRAALFVLSSRWEGSPNALTEALALGTPVVATDCPSGPREILDGGRIAPLVPVDDVDALAAAMAEVLENPGDRDARIAATSEYTVEHCAARYHALLEKLLEEHA